MGSRWRTLTAGRRAKEKRRRKRKPGGDSKIQAGKVREERLNAQ